MKNKFKTTPRDYQLAVYKASRNLTVAAYELDPGLGKTKITIDVACYQFTKKIIRAVIVTSLGRVADNWALEEFPKHCWDSVPTDIFKLDKSDKKATALFMHGLNSTPNPERLWVFTMNKEAWLDTKIITAVRKFMSAVPTMLVVDESTIIKNPAAKTTRLLTGISPRSQKELKGLNMLAKTRRTLTGTPITNSPVDIFPQSVFLHPDILGVTSRKEFIEGYCTVKKLWIPDPHKPGAKKSIESPVGFLDPAQIDEIRREILFRLKKEDVLKDLPPKNYIQVNVPLSSGESKNYDTLHDHLVLELTNLAETKGVIVATNVISSLVKLQQLLSGIAVTETGVKFFESAKIKAAKEILTTTDRQMIVWCRFRHTIEMLTAYLQKEGKTVSNLYGGMGAVRSQEAKEDFLSGKAQFLIAHPATAGWGLTFVNCSDALFLENSFNWEHRVQAEDRIHRIGQEASVCTYFDLVVPNSIDVKILDNLAAKTEFHGTFKGDDFLNWI